MTGWEYAVELPMVDRSGSRLTSFQGNELRICRFIPAS